MGALQLVALSLFLDGELGEKLEGALTDIGVLFGQPIEDGVQVVVDCFLLGSFFGEILFPLRSAGRGSNGGLVLDS